MGNSPTGYFDPTGTVAIYIPGKVTLSDKWIGPPKRSHWESPALETDVHAQWTIAGGAFDDTCAVEEIGVVQIFRKTIKSSLFRMWLDNTPDWTIDGGIPYPYPYPGFGPTHGDPTQESGLSFEDQPGTVISIAAGTITEFKFEAETYVIGLKGTYGLSFNSSYDYLSGHVVSLAQVTVFAAIKWYSEFKLQADGTWSEKRHITSTQPGDMSNLEAALSRRFYQQIGAPGYPMY